MISIIVPTYEHSKELPKCLDSICEQTFKDFEVIVVDDGSTDDTSEVLRTYQQKTSTPLRIIREEHRGANAARNRGFEPSRGEFLLFCDADLILKPTCLEKMRNALLKHPDKAYAYSAFKFGWKTFKLRPFDEERLRGMNFIHTSSLIRREAFPDFDERIHRFQDWDLWLTMLEQGKTGIYIPEVLFRIKPRKMGMSSWFPSFFLNVPWRVFGVEPQRIRTYREAERIIKKKHSLS